jgi:HD domain
VFGRDPQLYGHVGAAPTQAAVNLTVGPAIYATLWLGQPARAVAATLAATLPAAAVMLTLGALTAALLASLGPVALAGFAVIAIIPQSALTYAARARPVARLDPLTATRRYAAALALQLGLSRAARRELDAVVRLAHARPPSGDPTEHVQHTLLDASDVSCAAGHSTEWFNGDGGPAGIPGNSIPLSSRINAVATTWAALTAHGSPQLGHHAALKHLHDGAGNRLDPCIVRAARTVIAQERATAAVNAPEPLLHHFRVPAPLRRALAAAG